MLMGKYTHIENEGQFIKGKCEREEKFIRRGGAVLTEAFSRGFSEFSKKNNL